MILCCTFAPSLVLLGVLYWPPPGSYTTVPNDVLCREREREYSTHVHVHLYVFKLKSMNMSKTCTCTDSCNIKGFAYSNIH